MVHQMLSLGMILLLSSGCLPRFLPERNLVEPSSVEKQESSLFTQAELDQLFSKKEAMTSMVRPVTARA